jgi:hypothetical protein
MIASAYLIVAHGIIELIIVFFEPLLFQLKVPKIQVIVSMAHQNTTFVEAN